MDYNRASELGPERHKTCVNIAVPRRALGLRDGFEVVRRAGQGSSPLGEEGKYGREPELSVREEGRGKQPVSEDTAERIMLTIKYGENEKKVCLLSSCLYNDISV